YSSFRCAGGVIPSGVFFSYSSRTQPRCSRTFSRSTPAVLPRPSTQDWVHSPQQGPLASMTWRQWHSPAVRAHWRQAGFTQQSYSPLALSSAWYLSSSEMSNACFVDKGSLLNAAATAGLSGTSARAFSSERVVLASTPECWAL